MLVGILLAAQANYAPGVNRVDPFMDPFSYLSFLTSIVLGLGITRVLAGFGKLLQARGRVRLYWVHLLWALSVFLYLVLNWWILFRWHTQEQWTFFIFLFVLLSPTIGFLLSVLLFPEPLEAGTDLKQHFYGNHRWFFVLAAVLPPLDALDTLLKGVAHFTAQGPIYVITLVLIFGLSLVAASTTNERFHKFFAIFFLIYLSVFISINLNVLT
jgi:hypothetical protein